MMLSFLILATSVLADTKNPSAKQCQFDLDASQVKIAWTAFKTTAKAKAGGTFPGAKLTMDREKVGLEAALNAVTIEVDPTKLETGNAGRDINIVNGFFREFGHPGLIKGTVQNAKDKDGKGTFRLALTMNGKTRNIPMQYVMDAKGNFKATGKLNVLEFDLARPLKTLNKLCFELHKGADGVSKTWPDVEFEVTAPVEKTCK